MNELDLEELESRLYSQVYHSVNDGIEATNSQENSGGDLPKFMNDMRKPGRYFGPWSPAAKYHNAPPKNSSKTPGRKDGRQEGSYNKSFGKSRKPEISINQVVVVSPEQPIVYMTSQQKRRARWKLKLKEKMKQRQAQKELNASRPAKQMERHDVITLSDSEDDSCVIIDNKWPMLSLADSVDENKTASEENKEQSSNDNKTGLLNEQGHTLNESLSDDVIFVEPVPAEVINLDEEVDTNQEKHSETASSTSSDNISVNSTPTKKTQKIHQERKELLRTPDSASNDFMNNSGVELNQNNFNFSLHGSDFHNSEFLKPAPPTETCETESSSSTTDANSVNLMKTIVFNEVDFPKEDIFSENLESFGNFITPLRHNNSLVANVQSSPLKLPESQNRNVYCSDSSSESEYEESPSGKQIDVSEKLRNLPELSPMLSKKSVASPSVTKKTKKMSSLESKYDLINAGADNPTKDAKLKNSSKKKKKNKKKKSGNEENLSSFEKAGAEVVENIQVEEDLKKKKRRSTENSESENQPKRRSLLNNSNAIEETKSDDKLTPVEVLDSKSTENKKETEKEKTENVLTEENRKAEVTPSVVNNDVENITDGVDHLSSAINNTLQMSDERHKEVEHVEYIKTEHNNKEENSQEPDLQSSYLDGLVIVEEVFTQNTLLELSSDAESVLSPLHEKSDIKLNCEESKSDEKVCLPVEFGMDLNNYSVIDIQRNMPDDPELWTILDADRTPSRKNRGRRCNRCKQFGHVGIRCTNKVEPKCTLCGGLGHFEPRCPNKICTQCGQRSPYSTTYCNSCFKLRNYRCRRCSMPGHLPNMCPDLWRRYHLTTEEGPLIRHNGPLLKEKNQLWCSGCAQSGHLEHSCRFYKSIYPPTDPYIHSYEDTYKEETSQQQPIQYSPPQNYHTNNQLYQPISQRHVFRGNYVQNSHSNYNQVNPQFVSPFVDGVFVANQQNFFPHMPQNLLQYSQNNYPSNQNEFVFENPLPTFISFDSPVTSTNSYQEAPGIRTGSRYFKTKRGTKAANSLFFNSTAPQLQQFVNEELHRLTKIALMSNKLIQEVRKRRTPRDYEMLNMLLFGVLHLRDGKMHLEKLKQFGWSKKSRVDAGTRRRLHTSYCYIFGRDGNPNVDYNELLRIV